MAADQQVIRDIFERNVRTLTVKPSRGFLTFTTQARLLKGLRCEIVEGPWRLAADLSQKVGGDESAPNPGILGRGALASCLVLGIARWAARLGIVISDLAVEVQADYDARGEVGAGENIPAGYTEVRYVISIQSDAAAERIEELLDLAERHSPYLDVFGRALPLRRRRHLNGKKG